MSRDRAPSFSRPAAPAGMCSPPRRWPASSRRAACRSPWSPIRAAGSGRARCRASRSTTSISASPIGLARRRACRRCARSASACSMPGARSAASIRRASSASAAIASVPTMIAARLRRIAGDGARAERGAGPGQPAAAGRRRAGRDVVRRRPRFVGDDARSLVGNPVREPVRALRDQRLSRAGAGSRDRSAGVRRQPGRGVVQPGHSRGDRSRCPSAACARGCASCSSAGRRISSRSAPAIAQAGIVAELAPFFADLPQRLAGAHLVIGRSGASTVAELATIGRPSILVPYPYAADDHQTANARAFEATAAPASSSRTPIHRADALAGHLARAVRGARAHGRHGRRGARRRPAGCRRAAGRSRRRADRHAISVTVRSRRMRALPLDIGLIHFVGIGGIGMSGIAEVLHNLGYKVQGSDLADGANTTPPAPISASRSISAIAPTMSAAPRSWSSPPRSRRTIPRCWPRARALRAGRAPRRDAGRADAAQMVDRGRRHARQDHHDLDGRLDARCRRARSDGDQRRHHQRLRHQRPPRQRRLDGGRGRRIRRLFLRLPATIAVVTNIDPEHLDHYGTFDALRDAFVRFVENIPFYGFAVLCIDHPEVQALIPRVADRRIITYGLGANADVRALNLKLDRGGADFDVRSTTAPPTARAPSPTCACRCSASTMS